MELCKNLKFDVKGVFVMKIYVNTGSEELNADLAKEFDVCRNLIDCDVAVLSDILNKDYIRSLIAIGKKIILLTDKKNTDLIATAKEIGITDILLNPIDFDELVQTINKAQFQDKIPLKQNLTQSDLTQSEKNFLNQDKNILVYVDTGLESLDMTLKKQFKNRIALDFDDAGILISYKEDENEIDKLVNSGKEIILLVPNKELLNYAQTHGIVHAYADNCSIEDIIKAEKALQEKAQNNFQSDLKDMQETTNIPYVSYDEKHTDDKKPDEDAEKCDAIGDINEEELSEDEEKKILTMINQFIHKKTRELKEVISQLEKENSVLKDEKFQLEKNNSKLEKENQRLKHVLDTIKETLSGGEVK
jgi:hypothetical protein